MQSAHIKFAVVLKLSLVVFAFLFNPQAIEAQISRLAVSPTDAKRIGMEIMWRTQLESGPTAKLQNITQVFGQTKKLVKFVVTFQDVEEEFFEDDVDRFGRKIGAAGAKARAEAKLKRYQTIGFNTAKMERIVEDPIVLEKSYADLIQQYETAQGFAKGKLGNELRAIEARRKRLLADITFLAQSSTCLIQSIDGRSGKTNWTQQIGKRNHPSMPVVAKRKHFAVINASDVYCGLLENGRIAWQRECRGAPGSRAAMTKNSIFVPMVDGVVEQFVIRDGNAPTGDILSIGHSLLGATSSDSVVAWPSDRGELNVAFDTMNLKEVSYRLVPKKQITSNAAFLEPYLFATSTDGSLFCLNESNGKMMWEIPTGIPISRSPFAVGQYVYFINDNYQLNQVEIETGIPTWGQTGIQKVVCASAKRVYCLNRQNHLVVMDLKTGNYIGALTTKPAEFVYQNTMTDRLIVGTDRGLIQCLREIDQVEPIFYQEPEVAAETKTTPSKNPNQKQPSKQKPDNTDPFGGGGDDPFGGGGNDPFGGGGAKKGGDDPFGGADDDPFGGGGAKKGGDDPFGGADDDPFGGGGAKKGGDDDPFGK